MAGNAAAALADATRFGEVRTRVLFLLGALLVYRIGTFIPVPGIDPAEMARFFEDNAGTLLGMANMFSGGALERLSIFAMGVMPYISASIIVQMVSMVYAPWEEYRKEGESGRRKLTQITRYGTVFLAVFQSLGAATALQNGGMVNQPGWAFLFIATITMTTGTMFLMWLGEQVTERGIGNGISMLILAGIISGLPGAVGRTVEAVNTGEMSGIQAIVLLVLVLGVTAIVVYVERAQRRIAVHYAKRQVGRRVMAGQPLHLVLYGSLIVFFCFFYTALVFNARETSDNLKKSGAFIPGIRPGQQTGEYIDKVLTRLTLWGAIYVASVCLLPELLISQTRLGGGDLLLVFGGTSLLIVVVVAMDFLAQLQAHLMSHQYPGLLKQANLMGYGRSGAPQ